MMKDKPWSGATLAEVGGSRGVGVTFLEETFDASTAPPEHRFHQAASRAVLTALLPDAGTNLKGHMRSYQDLFEVSGYAVRPADFDNLMNLLNHELRLVTPTDPENSQPDSGCDTGGRFYQLTHDYLVPSLRDWLTRKQKETRRGRAELRLEERAALWNDKPEGRRLPSLGEYLSIRLLTNRRRWTAPQQRMMSKARRVHALHSALATVILMMLIIGGRDIYGRSRANSLVEQLRKADVTEVRSIVASLDAYRSWADSPLKLEEVKAKDGSPQKLHFALALLPVDATQVAYLRDQLLVVTPTEFPVVRDVLLAYQDEIIEPLWKVALDPKISADRRFQAACALGTFAADDKRWDAIGTLVANHLVSRQASEFLAWKEALRPAKSQLIPPLGVIYRDMAQERQARNYATETLADYATDQPDLLFGLLVDAEQFQFQAVFGKLAAHKERAIMLARQERARRRVR